MEEDNKTLDEVENQENSNPREKDNRYTGTFGIFPFLFTGMYYAWHCKFLFGSFLVALCIILPLKWYFIVGLVVSLFCGKVEGSATYGSVIISILLGILFVIIKILRFVFTGGI